MVGNNPSEYKGDLRPVERVCYDTIRGSGLGSHWPADNLVDVDTFLGRIRVKTGRLFDLPTEAQWEYACRAGTTTAFNNGKDLTDPYLKSDNMYEIGRYGANKNDGKGGYAQHTTVGSYPANGWGLYDMHGNVAEWCRDWLVEDLGSEAVVDPIGPLQKDAKTVRIVRNGISLNNVQFRGIRGGGWSNDNSSFHQSGWRSCATQAYHTAVPAGEPSFSSYNVWHYSACNDWGFRLMCEANVAE